MSDIVELREWAAWLRKRTCDDEVNRKYQRIADYLEAQSRTTDAELERLREALEEVERLKAERDTPEVHDFMRALPLEAEHQRARWGSEHDAGKTPFDWFWLVGYLAQKAASAAVAGDEEKAKHHTISTAAALANWHLALTGVNTAMRPGIEEPRDARAA